jgi:uncharacterized lipoprotein YmbA
MISITRALGIVALASLAACSSSAPTQYYTLIAPPMTEAPSTDPVDFQLLVQSLRMPVQVDQPQLVVRQGNGKLAILESERWGSPLADEFHDALVSQLETRLGTRDLAGLPRDSKRDLLSLRVDVRRFESIPAHYALVDTVWSLNLRSANGDRRSLTCSSVITKPAGDTLESVVVSHQQAVGSLGETIAATARAWVASPANSRCP